MAKRKIEVQILGDSKSLERAFARSGKAGEKFGTSLSDGSRRVARNIGIASAAVVGLGAVAVKSFASFEESLERVVGLAGGAQKQVNKFGDEILRLGPEVAKGPQELGEALYFVASSGIAVSKQMGVVRASAKASAAGLGETQTVADAVTSAMNAYGQSVLSASQATDVLVATVREGKGEAAAFAPVIGTVASIASELGVAFEEVGAALAAQTRLGVSAETSAVQLQAFFSSLLKSTPKTEKAFKRVGLSLKGLRDQLKGQGLLSVLRTLRDRFGDNTAAMAEAFPNIRALRGLLSLVGKNAAEVRGVFERMKDSTGALDTAFGAVSKGTAFAFKQTMSSLAVVGIRLGAIFAPVAKVIARGATSALTAVGDLIDKLGKAKTVRAKLDVIWTGVTEAGRRATDLLGRAVARIDFDAVWAKATDIADGLQTQLEKTDFSVIGKQIGDAFVEATRFAIPAAKEMAARLNKAFAAVDFDALGKQLGPALALAVATAFVTLTDPVFWAKNWELAIGVAAVAVGGPIGKLGARLGLVFGKLGADAVQALAGAVERLSPRVGEVLLAALLRLPGLVGRALAPLVTAVKKAFDRLGRIGQFTVKVLGVTAAINVLKDFVKSVGRIFGALGQTIIDAFTGVWEWLKRKALEAALTIIDPFTRIPRWLGGGAFKDLQAEWSATLLAMTSQTTTETALIQGHIDGLHGKTVTVSVVTRGGGGGGDEGKRPPRGGNTTTTVTKTVVKDAKDAKGVAEVVVKSTKDVVDASNKAGKAQTRRQKAFEKLMGALDLDLRRAEGTKSLQDDLKFLNAQEKAIKDMIRVSGRTLELQEDLLTVTTRQAEVAKEIAERAKTRRQENQFKALGLTSTGEARVASTGALKKRLGTLKDQIKGTFLDTPKTQAELARIGKVLGGKFGAVGREVRSAIQQMFADISGALGQGGSAGGPLTKFSKGGFGKLIEGVTGLSPEQVKRLRQQFAQFGPNGSLPRDGQSAFGFPQGGGGGAGAGAGAVVIENRIYIEGVEATITRQQQIRKSRTAAQRRGVRPGIGGV